MNEQHHTHRDDYAAKMGMWIFLFTEILLFGGLFLVYSIYRSQYHELFHEASKELSIPIGLLNTVVLLTSSMFIAMSITAMQKNNKKLALTLVLLTILSALVFLVNKYFEWGAKFHHGLVPGSEHMMSLPHGKILYFSLYFFMTGLHALHIIIGMIILLVVYFKIHKNDIHSTKYVLLENGALYWHLVDLIWIFLFPLLYLIT